MSFWVWVFGTLSVVTLLAGAVGLFGRTTLPELGRWEKALASCELPPGRLLLCRQDAHTQSRCVAQQRPGA